MQQRQTKLKNEHKIIPSEFSDGILCMWQIFTPYKNKSHRKTVALIKYADNYSSISLWLMR